jgi:hypothetical protein
MTPRPDREREQLRADLAPRDPDHWRQVHLAGDRNPPIFLPDRRVRRSVGTATCWRSKGGEAQCYE